MATTTVPLCTPTIQPTRRTLLGALAAAPLATAPAALAAATEINPHVAWGAEWRAVLDYCNGPGPHDADLEDTPEGQRMFELQELIAETPATTLPGVAAQLALVLEYRDAHPDEEAVGQDLVALRNMRDTVADLTGGDSSVFRSTPVRVTEADPHGASEREARAIEARANARGMEEDAGDALVQEAYAIEDRIGAARAQTLAGVAVQLRLIQRYLDLNDGISNSGCEVDACRNALATVRQLRGRAVA